MANKVVIEVEARFVDEVTGKSKYVVSGLDGIGDAANAAQRDLDKLGKKRIHPIIDADNNKFLKKMRESENKAARIAGKSFTATLKVMDFATDKINRAEAGLKSLTRKTWTTLIKIKDYATAPLRKIKESLFSIKSLVMAVTAGFAAKKLVLDPINLADAYSGTKIGFSTLLGDTEGQAMMDAMDEFAKKTPFKTSGVINNAQKMMAYGWDPERILEDMETIGDAAAATGKMDEGLASIVYALSEIRSKGKLSTQELNQLASAGIKAKAYLAEGLGYGTSDEGLMKLSEDLEKGAIGANQAIELILEGMKEFDGMMDRMAGETVEGLMSQISDAFEISILRKWGQGLQDGAKRGFGSIVELLDKAQAGMEKFGDLLFEVGEKLSNWAADKLETVVKRITDITDSFEFENASFGQKLAMLWKGVVADPFREWFDKLWRSEESVQKATDFGKRFAESLTKGILMVLGVTDIFEEGGLSKKGGTNIAQGFAKGFVEGFDVSAITEKLKEAISNVWGVLPWWAKALLIGKGIGMAGNFIGSIGNLIGGVSGFFGGAGKMLGSAASGAGLLGYGSNAAIALGAGNLAGGASLGVGALSALGLGATAGGIAGGVSLVSGGIDLYRGYTSDDEIEAKANKASGWSKVGGVGTGAALGATVGSIVPGIGTAVGALIGAGIGGLTGWIYGDSMADSIRAAKYESEEMQAAIKDSEKSAEEMEMIWRKAVWERQRQIFGDIALSAGEISTLSKQIVIGNKVAAMDEFAAATQQAEASLESVQSTATALNKWNWKAGLGLDLTENDQEGYVAAINEYMGAAQNYLENKHYEFTASVGILMETEEGSKGAEIIKSSDEYYAGLKEKVAGYSEQLSELMGSAMENGNLSDVIEIEIDGKNFKVDEQSAIEMLQEKIANIVNSINKAEEQAQLDLIGAKFETSGISYDSYTELQAGIDAFKETALGNLDEAQLNVLTSLNLQLDQAKTPEEKKKIEAQIDQTLESYGLSVEELDANVNKFVLNLAAENFSSEDLLGKDAMDKINKLIAGAVKEGISPAELTGEDVKRILGLENLDMEAAQVLADILSNLNFEEVLPEGVELPEVDATVDMNITADKYVQALELTQEEFGIPERDAISILFELTGLSTVVEQVSYLANEFGIPESDAASILWNLTGQKGIITKLGLTAADFGAAGPFNFSPTVNVNPIANVTPLSGIYQQVIAGQGYRGGIFGGDSAMDAFARGGRTDDGIVDGSTRFIRVNEESPEMIIPLSSQRRGRALKLWAKTGELLDVPGYARGGYTGGGADEDFRFHGYGAEASGEGQTIQIDVGGITLEIHVNGTDAQSIAAAIKAQVADIAEDVAGIMADAFAAQFENTPARGGAA